MAKVNDPKPADNPASPRDDGLSVWRLVDNTGRERGRCRASEKWDAEIALNFTISHIRPRGWKLVCDG